MPSHKTTKPNAVHTPFDALRQLAKEAFNLDVREVWPTDTPSSQDLRLAFLQRPRFEQDRPPLHICNCYFDGAVVGYDRLAQRMEIAFKRATQFLTGSRFLDGHQQEVLKRLIGSEGLNTPVLHLPTHTASNSSVYDLALDMHKAELMKQMGLSVDFGQIFDHFKTYMGEGPWGDFDQEKTCAVRAFTMLLSLGTVYQEKWGPKPDQMFPLYLIEGNNNASSVRSIKTGELINSLRDPSTPRETQIENVRFEVSLQPAFLLDNEIQKMSGSLNRHIVSKLPQFAELSLPLFEARGREIVIPYNTVDFLLRRGIRKLDCSPVFAKFDAIQQRRIARVETALDVIEDSLGYRLCQKDALTKSILDANVKKERFNFSNLSLHFERSFTVPEEMLPKRQSVFDETASVMTDLLRKSGLSPDEITVEGLAKRGMMCAPKDDLFIQLKSLTIEKAEAVAKKLAAIKDDLLPLMAELIGFSDIHKAMPERSDRKAKGAAIDTARRFAQEQDVMAIESLRTGHPISSFEDRSRCGGGVYSVCETVDYLVGSTYDADPRVKELAQKALSDLAGLSPVFAFLVAQKSAASPHEPRKVRSFAPKGSTFQ